jgi:uncharacterized OB-fold protein
MSVFAAPRYSVSPSCQLAGSRCRVCGRFACPPRMSHCELPEELVELAPDGQIESFSDVRMAPRELNPPYRIAYVRLTAGPRAVARLRGSVATCEDPTGTLVRLAVDVVGFGGAPALVAAARDEAEAGGARWAGSPL